MNDDHEIRFPRIDNAAVFERRGSGRPVSQAARLGAGDRKRSVVVRVNPELLGRFKKHCAQNRCSITDGVMTAHVRLGETVQETLRPTEEDQELIALGLAPRSMSDRLGPGDPLSLWITPQALDLLDSTAAEVGATRRRYVTTLLQVLLDDADTPPADT